MTEPKVTYTVRMRERGQVTIPRVVRERLATEAGDVLTLLQLDDVVILTPRTLQVEALSEAFVAEMEAADVSLADLLAGLAEERRQGTGDDPDA